MAAVLAVWLPWSQQLAASCPAVLRGSTVVLLPQMENLKDVMSLDLGLTAEEANKNLHKFRGKATLHDERFRDMPLSPAPASQADASKQAAGGWARASGGSVQGTYLLPPPLMLPLLLPPSLLPLLPPPLLLLLRPLPALLPAVHWGCVR